MIFTLKTRLNVLLLFIVLCVFPISATGQQGNPPPPPPGHGLPGDQKPNDTPLDNGLGILTLMGFAFMAKKAWKGRRQNNK